jgi:hypothetical protein
MYIYFKEYGFEFEVSGKPKVEAMKKIFEHDYPSTVDKCLSNSDLKEQDVNIYCRSR